MQGCDSKVDQRGEALVMCQWFDSLPHVPVVCAAEAPQICVGFERLVSMEIVRQSPSCVESQL